MAIPKQKEFLLLTFLFINSFISFSFCQSDSPQNIETFFPPSSPSPSPSPSTNPPSLPPTGSNLPVPTPTKPLTPPPPPPPPDEPSPPLGAPSPPSSSSRKAIFTAVGVTAAGTLLVALAALFLCSRYTSRRRKDGGGRTAAFASARAGGGGGGGDSGRLQPMPQTEFARFDGNIKGLIVDEDGLDVLYWRKLNGSRNKSGPFQKEVFKKTSSERKSQSSGRSSSSSSSQVHPRDDQTVGLLDSNPPPARPVILQAVGNQNIESLHSSGASSKELKNMDISKEQAALSTQPATPPPPPPPIPADKGPVTPPPPPPPVPAKKGPVPPPPPPKKGGMASSSKPPAAPKRTPSGNIIEVSAIGEDATEEHNDQVKLKPLHWEKVNVNTDHSMVWDKIERGSFQYNGDMMEALFGYVAANRKTPNEGAANAENKANANPAAKIFILDSRRSQNIAIVVRSLGISRKELIAGLQEGKGLNVETLEKLARMIPTREEKTEILGFDGDASRLADAESFLYHLLKEIPSAFTRMNAMLFRFTYDSEIQQLTESLQTLDSACTELRSRGVFLKLLEAILKAGNRLNAGTARGDAKAFNLSALHKLSDYKSSDGKTTLLHFVVHEVVRNEGRRCVMNRNNSLTRSNSQKSSITNLKPEEPQTKEEQEKEFLKLGLPVVGGLSAEFSNVKKAASIDWDTISSTCTSLTTRTAETRQLVLQCGADGRGEFVKEMKEFLGEAEGEIEAVKEEQKKVMEFVKKTTQYYQAGAFKDKQPLQMFVTVKDFLGMVDQACIEIARSLQQRKPNVANIGSSAAPSSPSSPPTPDVLRTRVTFPRLPAHFLSDRS